MRKSALFFALFIVAIVLFKNSVENDKEAFENSSSQKVVSVTNENSLINN